MPVLFVRTSCCSADLAWYCRVRASKIHKDESPPDFWGVLLAKPVVLGLLYIDFCWFEIDGFVTPKFPMHPPPNRGAGGSEALHGDRLHSGGPIGGQLSQGAPFPGVPLPFRLPFRVPLRYCDVGWGLFLNLLVGWALVGLGVFKVGGVRASELQTSGHGFA